MISDDNLFFVASWDTAQMNDREVDAYCECLAAVMRKLNLESNWAKTMGEVFEV